MSKWYEKFLFSGRAKLSPFADLAAHYFDHPLEWDDLVELETNNQEYSVGVIRIYMPGITPNRLHVELNFNQLKIKGVVDEKIYERKISFPPNYTADADNTIAELKDATVIVRVRLYHRSFDETAKEIPIKTT